MSNKWKISKKSESAVLQLNKAGIPSSITDILLKRGYISVSPALEYLRPSLFELHSPFLFNDMEKVVARLDKALQSREKVLIYGDYDVDGVTATALMFKVLLKLSFNVLVHIPKREEGYGLHKDIIEKAAGSDVGLIITVDCGINAVEEISWAATCGIDIIITDHHEPSEALPAAVGILNPKADGSGYPFKHLAGVGVAFKLVQALFCRYNYPFTCGTEFEYLDLVALGTVADIVPLIGENRILVKYGLIAMENSKHTGIKALLEECGLNGKKLKAGQISFMAAPRINAAGRMDTARLALNLLLEEDYGDALNIAKDLSAENNQRQLTEKKILQEADLILAGAPLPEVIVLSSTTWHHGVIGIVASRLVEKYGRPVYLIAEEENVGKGSARGIKGYNVFDELSKLVPLLIKFGGHKQAAGFTIETENIKLLREALIKSFIAGGLSFQQEFLIDAAVPYNELDFNLEKELEQMAPFGADNPAPLLFTSNLTVKKVQIIGKEGDHLKLTMEAGGHLLEGLAYKRGQEFEQLSKLRSVDIIYTLEVNNFHNEKKLQAVLKDYRQSAAESLDEVACTEEQIKIDSSPVIRLTRQMLVDFYKILKSMEDNDGFIVWRAGPDQDRQLQMIKIFEELGIVTWLGGTGTFLIRLNNENKADLTTSLRFRILSQTT